MVMCVSNGEYMGEIEQMTVVTNLCVCERIIPLSSFNLDRFPMPHLLSLGSGTDYVPSSPPHTPTHQGSQKLVSARIN